MGPAAHAPGRSTRQEDIAMTAAIIIAVVIAVIVLAWLGNSARLARKNNNLGRRSPGLTGRGGADVDDQNRQV